MVLFPDVQSYLRFCEHPDISKIRPQVCSMCGTNQPLRFHGHYKRNVWCEEHCYKIIVFRFLCGRCCATVSVLPSFVGRYQRTAWDLQEDVLAACEDGASLEKAGSLVPPPSGPISYRTVWRWKKAWELRMESAESGFWKCVLSVRPTLQWPRGTARPKTRIRLWQWIWHQAAPMGMAVGLFHGLFRLCQPSACFKN
ncbi:hypothetical protein J2S03_002522 [Alicyclobacillus cycloheptanicus]|uniref:Transposase n=1 Tax=Alicyclobacillus cycloheptanicus TaxID=1457 RepID=A0ABT9XKJ0_9BACL|nr:hypothetical protein [Alicyclobacillus cycloheptanicus]